MPRITIDIGDYDPNAAPAEGFDNYSGPIPPAGLYNFKSKLWRLKESSAGNTMFFVVLEIDEPKDSDKAQFNGYAMFHNAVLTAKSAPFTNAFFAACGIDPTVVGKKGAIQTHPDKDEDVLAIGKTKVVGLTVKALTKRETYEGQPKLTATTWHSAESTEGSSDEDDLFADDDEPTPAPKAKAGTKSRPAEATMADDDAPDAIDDDVWGDDEDGDSF